MCGLGLIYSYNSSNRVDVEELRKIGAQMSARGPDGKGEYVSRSGTLGMIHRRLAILDLTSAGSQPMQDSEGKIRIVFNGEIYNYIDLRKALEAKGYKFVSRSDTEVLINMYKEHGTDMLQMLRGMFAFAIWDGKKEQVFLARDPLGIKPLYYSDDGKTFRAASQVKALLAGGSIETSESPAGHVGFHLWGHVPEPFTLYKKIQALPAGSYLLINRSRPTGIPEKYYVLAERIATADRQSGEMDAIEQEQMFSSIFRGSVECHLQSDVPVGVFLSSGIDSATIAAIARNSSSQPLHAVTLCFEEYRNTPIDELPLAAILAEELGLVHHVSKISRQDFMEESVSLMAAMDQPTVDGVNSYFVSKAAREHGLKVMLSGVGGDELLGGYPSFSQIPKLVKYAKAWASMGSMVRRLSAPVLSRVTSPKYASLFEFGNTIARAYFLRRSLFMPWELEGMLDPSLVRAGMGELGMFDRLEQTTQGYENDFERVSALEVEWYMRNQLLRDLDWASMSHSLEVRTPFVDTRFFEAVLPISSRVFPEGKKMLAKLSGEKIYNTLANRKKTGFSIPVQHWSADNSDRHDRGLRGWARTVYRSYWDR